MLECKVTPLGAFKTCNCQICSFLQPVPPGSYLSKSYPFFLFFPPSFAYIMQQVGFFYLFFIIIFFLLMAVWLYWWKCIIHLDEAAIHKMFHYPAAEIQWHLVSGCKCLERLVNVWHICSMKIFQLTNSAPRRIILTIRIIKQEKFST